MRYLLGIDGGNTKTDYLLYTEDGAFVDVYRTGTCSHEAFDDSFDGMEAAMREQLSVLLTRNNISAGDISASGMGLAGADYPSQVAELTRRAENIGFKNFIISNDGVLGIKAMSDTGTGVCVVNGTGTVVIGIDADGKILQVGGVGDISGDQAGGGWAARQIMHDLYAYYFRCGDDSSMFPVIMEMLGLTPDGLLEAVDDYRLLYGKTVDILQLADREARAGDATARRVFDNIGINRAYSAAGCVKLLNFNDFGTDDNPIPIILVGSVWHKITYDGMKTAFMEYFKKLSKKACVLVPMDAPAAAGGVLWAKELLDNAPVEPAYRAKVLESLTLGRYESLVYK